MPVVDETGNRYGRLVVIARGPNSRGGKARWLCACDCGNATISQGVALRAGIAQSCGCARGDAISTHGHSRGRGTSRTYRAWRKMHERCRSPSCRDWPNYGGRGIGVCKRWSGSDGFANFLADMGECPPTLTLDRRDVNGHYEPGNCRWASATEQRANRRDSLTPNAVRSIRDARAAGLSYRDIGRRFGVSDVTARNIATRQTWSHLP